MNKKRISMGVLTVVTAGILAFSSVKLPVSATESYSLPVVEDTDAGEGHIYSTPANLKWSDTVPGRISFDVTDATRGYLYVEVYKDGLFHTSIGTYRDSEGTFSLDLDRSIYDTGAYTFRVKMSADKSEGYKDMSKGSVSEMSEAFNYVRPEVAVATPVNLRWSSESENVAEWDPVENAKWYSVIVYSDGDFYLERQVKGDKNSIDLSDYIADVDNHTIQFTVRADSKNINTWAHGAESELSPALKPGASVSGMQNKIAAASDADESTVNEAVTQLATEEDKQTMRDAIQNSTEAQQNLSRLENTYTQKNNIEVSSSSTVDAIPSDGISVVGAGLNVSEAGSSVSLNVTPVPFKRRLC